MSKLNGASDIVSFTNEHFNSLTVTISSMRFELHYSPRWMKRGRGGRVRSIHSVIWLSFNTSFGPTCTNCTSSQAQFFLFTGKSCTRGQNLSATSLKTKSRY